MPVTSVLKDPDQLTMTIVAEFTVPVQRLWDAYADPRQIEKFWGPPGFPATFFRHDMAVGGESHYMMTGPDGETYPAWWEFLDIVEGEQFTVLDGFGNADGSRADFAPPMRMEFIFEATPDGSRVITKTLFASTDALEQMMEMGMDEGLETAMGQIDSVLADLASFAADIGTNAQILSDTQIRVSRVIRGSVEQVWHAHHDPAVMAQWFTGPDGWTMTECELTDRIGGSFQYSWAPTDGSEGAFGFEGELLESAPPHREVTTERMQGTDGPNTRNEMTLTPVAGGTLLSLVITYPSVELRDEILNTGMTDGMEAGYARLEAAVLPVAS